MLNKDFLTKTIKKDVLKEINSKNFKPSSIFGKPLKFLEFEIWHGKDDFLGLYSYIKRDNDFIFFTIDFEKAPQKLVTDTTFIRELIEDFPNGLINELRVNSFNEPPILDLNTGKHYAKEFFLTNIKGLSSLNDFFDFSNILFFKKEVSYYYYTRIYTNYLLKDKTFSISNCLERASWNPRINEASLIKIISLYIANILSTEKKDVKNLNELAEKHFLSLRNIEKNIYRHASDKKQLEFGINHIISTSIIKLSPNILSFENFDFNEYYALIMDKYSLQNGES